MGNNRMVVNKNGTKEQITHYYPYGGVIGDISTNESVQKYKLFHYIPREQARSEDKELDRTFGLDNYDIHARQYFAMAPMWDKPDSKAEDYYPISPYAYCGGDPVNLGDYDGKRVKPKEDESLSIILNTLPVEARQYIILDQEGYIDQETMKQYKGAETFSHEGYGHAFIYVNTNGDRSRAIHHPVNDGTKTIETNQELFERSIKARKETIKNMGQ